MPHFSSDFGQSRNEAEPLNELKPAQSMDVVYEPDY